MKPFVILLQKTLLACLLLLSLAYPAQAQTWETYKFTQAGCSAMFPEKPDTAQEGDIWTAQAKENDIIYQIVVSAKSSTTANNTTTLLNETINGFINPTTDKIEKSESLQMNGLPAKQVSVRSQDGTYLILRAVVSDSKLYQIAIAGTNAAQTTTQAQKFLNNFKIQ